MKDERAEDMKAMGVSPEDIAKILPPKPIEEEHYEVFEENWQTVLMFLRCQTQWRTAGMGGMIGMDYSVIQWMFKVYKVEDERQQLEDLQIMEAAALKKLAQK